MSNDKDGKLVFVNPDAEGVENGAVINFKNVYFYKMYYRRKIILSLLQVFGGELEKIQLQKLLFLFC